MGYQKYKTNFDPKSLFFRSENIGKLSLSNGMLIFVDIWHKTVPNQQ